MFECPERQFVYLPSVDGLEPSEYDDPDSSEFTEIQNVDENKANLISSFCGDGLHAPVLDIDFPIHVLPSSQLGHHHLYIDKKMTWEDYSRLLKLLSELGVVEEGYCKASLSRGYSAVRKPGVQKPKTGTVGGVLQENSYLKAQLYKVNKQLEELKEQHKKLCDDLIQAQSGSWV